MNEKRWVSIASSIKVAIRRGDLRAGARLATEIEMARQWDVSPMTVNRALTELQREGWVVRRRRVGTVVADRSEQPITKIGLVFTGHTGLPQAAYLSGIEEGLADDVLLVPLSTNGKPAEEARCLERAVAECAAIICYPTGAAENTAQLKAIATTMPLLFIDGMPEGIDADVMMTDNFGSIQLGLRHLKALGHTRIAYFIESPHYVSSVKERYEGYKQFMAQEIGLSNPDQWVHRFATELPREQYYERVEAVLAELLSGSYPVTAVACQQDSVMARVLEACIRLRIDVRDEIAILSFNDMQSRTQAFSHDVYRLVQRPSELGNMAAKRIQLRLASPDLPPQAMRLMTNFYAAGSYTQSAVAKQFIESRRSS